MPNTISYTCTLSEVVEFVDRSAHVARTMASGMVNQNVKPDFEIYPSERRVVVKLKMVLQQPSGELILKIEVRLDFSVSVGMEDLEGRDASGLPREVYVTLGHEAWDFMMKHLRSRKTPIAKVTIPSPPDDIFADGNVYGVSLN